jgi:hypothetical protein
MCAHPYIERGRRSVYIAAAMHATTREPPRDSDPSNRVVVNLCARGWATPHAAMRLVPLFAGAVEAEGAKISLATLARVLVAVDVDRGENDNDTNMDTDDNDSGNGNGNGNGNSGNERHSMPCYAIAGLYERLAELCDENDHGEAGEPRAGGLGAKQPALAPPAPPRRPLGRRRSRPAAMATIAEGRRAPAPEIAVRISDKEAPPGPRLRFVRSRPAAAGDPLVFTDRVRVRPGGLVHVSVLRGESSLVGT